MRIQDKKIFRGSYRFVGFVFLLLIMVVVGVGSDFEEQEHLLAYLIDSGDINQDMAELLRTNCRRELSHAQTTLRDIDVCFIKESSTDSERLMCPQVREILLECLRDKSLMRPVSVGEDTSTRDTSYSGSPSSRRYSSRRRELTQTAAEEQNAHMMSIIIAVVATAVVTLIVAVLMFCCFIKCCGGSGRVKKDEKPLLSLSLSENSVASSQKLYVNGTSTNEEKLGNQSLNNKLSNNKTNGDIFVESHSLSNSKRETTTAESPVGLPPGIPPLKPPPGRNITLKPPPGRAPVVAPPAPPAPTPPAPAPPPPPPPMRPPPSGGPGPPPPPPPPAGKAGPRPPPSPVPGAAAPQPPPLGLKSPRAAASVPNPPSTSKTDDGASKTKLKPFFWDKVMANPEQTMVWHQLRAGSFQFNEEMIESLFGYAPAGKNKNGTKKESSFQDSANQFIQIIDPKKAQNLSILLKALNVTTEEVYDALEEGNELPPELIQTLLKMAPTGDEELKLRLYTGELFRLGPAERFLKALVEIPYAFKRLECLLFMCTLEEEATLLKDSFEILEAACTELRKSRLFLKLLEAVLKTGNRMNDGTFRGGAQAFKLDTLLKLSDVKGMDGKTTLLHFVVQEIIRSEGVRAARAAKEMRSMSSFRSEDLVDYATQDSDDYLRSLGLQVVSGVGNELEHVKKAALIDADTLTATVSKLGHALVKARDFLNSDMKNVPEDNGFHQTLTSFVQNADGEVMRLLEEEKRITALTKSTADYFHGTSGKEEGLRLFIIVRDFLVILDKVCKEVRSAPRRPPSKTSRKEGSVGELPPDPKQSRKEDSVRTPPLDPKTSRQEESVPTPPTDLKTSRREDSVRAPPSDPKTSRKDKSVRTHLRDPKSSGKEAPPPQPKKNTATSAKADNRHRLSEAITDRWKDSTSSDDD